MQSPARCGPYEWPLPEAVMLAELRREKRSVQQLSGGLGPYLPERIDPLIALVPERHVLASAETLAIVPGSGDATDVYEANRRLTERLDAHPEERGRLQVVPLYLTRRAA